MYNHVFVCQLYYVGKVKLAVKYSPKILEEMEQRFEHSKSFRRGRSSRK